MYCHGISTCIFICVNFFSHIILVNSIIYARYGILVIIIAEMDETRCREMEKSLFSFDIIFCFVLLFGYYFYAIVNMKNDCFYLRFSGNLEIRRKCSPRNHPTDSESFSVFILCISSTVRFNQSQILVCLGLRPCCMNMTKTLIQLFTNFI